MTRAARARRIVSLLPSATEIVCAVGGAGELVGISHECDYPDEIRDRPVLTRSRLPGDRDGSGSPVADASSLAIDQAVRALLRDALSIYQVDEERLAGLAPDVIVTQDLCEVCAVSLDDVRGAVARLASRDQVSIVSLRPTRLADVLGDVERVAAALGRADAGREVRASLERRIDAIAARAAAATERPRVASIEWIEPLMLGGTWMPELIERAGGTAVGAAAGQLAPTIEPDELARLAPDVVVIKPCGFTMERALGEREAIERSIAGPAGPRARIAVTDGSAFFNRPGPRLVESLEILAACIHPGLFGDLAAEHARVTTWLQ
ncbi:MAG TPA: ABC transporter substrate-binding protein [Kofleriaceae bacterium]|nr:ABC transporter substrate-binding protein [Kofleriaceae bacterium]